MISADPVPLCIQVNITGHCPCRCWHCEKAFDREGRDLDDRVLHSCLRQAANWNCPILYSGGEPLAHPRWPDLLREGRALGVTQKLITSGAGLERLSPDLLDLLASSLDELLISLDSADARTHDDLRGRPGLHAAVTRYLFEAPRPRRIWLVHVPDADLDSVAPMIELAAALRVGLIVQPYSFASNFPHLDALAAKMSVRASLPAKARVAGARARGLAAVAARSGVPSNLGEVAVFISSYYEASATREWYGRHLSPGFGCSIPWQQLTVDEHGRVLPCALLAGSEVPAGMSLEEHWRLQALAHRAVMSSGRTWPECRSCTCHFSANMRNSFIAAPWRNRSLLRLLVGKRLVSARHGRAADRARA